MKNQVPLFLISLAFANGAAFAQLNVGMFLKAQNIAAGLTCGDSAANNCYTGTNSAVLQSAGIVTTPSGKSLRYVDADGSGTRTVKVWREASGNRILRANGLDQWAKALNSTGKGLSATDFTDSNLESASTVIAGRVCPTNMYIDDTNKFTTGNCIYHSPEYSTTTPTWVAKWYAGNFSACSSKGMRAPTLYETNTNSYNSSVVPNNSNTNSSYRDGNPVFAGTNGVPATNGSGNYTATGCTENSPDWGLGSFMVWYPDRSSSSEFPFLFPGGTVICVLP